MKQTLKTFLVSLSSLFLASSLWAGNYVWTGGANTTDWATSANWDLSNGYYPQSGQDTATLPDADEARTITWTQGYLGAAIPTVTIGANNTLQVSAGTTVQNVVHYNLTGSGARFDYDNTGANINIQKFTLAGGTVATFSTTGELGITADNADVTVDYGTITKDSHGRFLMLVDENNGTAETGTLNIASERKIAFTGIFDVGNATVGDTVVLASFKTGGLHGSFDVSELSTINGTATFAMVDSANGNVKNLVATVTSVRVVVAKWDNFADMTVGSTATSGEYTLTIVGGEGSAEGYTVGAGGATIAKNGMALWNATVVLECELPDSISGNLITYTLPHPTDGTTSSIASAWDATNKKLQHWWTNDTTAYGTSSAYNGKPTRIALAYARKSGTRSFANGMLALSQDALKASANTMSLIRIGAKSDTESTLTGLKVKAIYLYDCLLTEDRIPAPANPGIIGINFANNAEDLGSGTDTLGFTSDAKGGAIALDSWNKLSGGVGFKTDVKDANGNATYTIKWSSNTDTWKYGNKSTAIEKLTYGYLDNGTGTQNVIQMSGLPTTGYDIAIIGGGDGPNRNDQQNQKFSYYTVNGTNYTYSTTDSATVEGTGTWGTRNGASALTEGTNVLYISGLTDSTLEIQGYYLNDATVGYGRGTTAAIMIFPYAIDATAGNVTVDVNHRQYYRGLSDDKSIILSSSSDYGVTLGYTNNQTAQFGPRLIVESGKHTFQYGEGANNEWASGDSNDNPTILVKNGAELDFYGKDMGGWNTDSSLSAVVRVNDGGKLNIKYYDSNTFYYHNRLFLEEGAEVVVETKNDGNTSKPCFRLQGNATEELAQLYVPAVQTKDDKIAKISGGGIFMKEKPGVAVSVGDNATLEIASPISSSDDTGYVKKYGAGTLVLSGANTLTSTVTAEAGTLEIKVDPAASTVTYPLARNNSATIVKSGAGTFVWNAATGTGPIQVNGGTLKINSSNNAQAIQETVAVTVGTTTADDGTVTQNVLEVTGGGATYADITGKGITKITGESGFVFGTGADKANVTTDLVVDGALKYLTWGPATETAIVDTVFTHGNVTITTNGSIAHDTRQSSTSKGSLNVAAGKSLINAGTISVPVTMETGAKLGIPATAGTVSNDDGITFGGTLVIQADADYVLPATGAEVLKSTTAMTLPATVTIKKGEETIDAWAYSLTDDGKTLRLDAKINEVEITADKLTDGRIDWATLVSGLTLSGEADVTVKISADAIVTLPTGTTELNNIVVNGTNEVTFEGGALTIHGVADLQTNVDVSGITADLGDVTLAADKMLTIGANSSLTSLNASATGATLVVTDNVSLTPATFQCRMINIAQEKTLDVTAGANWTIWGTCGGGTLKKSDDKQLDYWNDGDALVTEGTTVRIEAGTLALGSGMVNGVVTAPYAGEGKLSFASGVTTSGDNLSLSGDLEIEVDEGATVLLDKQMQSADADRKTLTKTGAGRFEVNNLQSGIDAVVEAGTLYVKNGTASETTIVVKKDATLLGTSSAAITFEDGAILDAAATLSAGITAVNDAALTPSGTITWPATNTNGGLIVKFPATGTTFPVKVLNKTDATLPTYYQVYLGDVAYPNTHYKLIQTTEDEAVTGLSVKKVVAKIGEMEYESLASAITNANGVEINLLLDTNEAINLESGTLSIKGVSGKLMGAITVASGATLALTAGDDYTDTAPWTLGGKVTNHGTLNTSGFITASVASATDGTLNVNAKTLRWSSVDRGIAGTVNIAKTATFVNLTTDALNYNATSKTAVHVRGTLDFGEKRWTVGAYNTIYLYDEALISGTGGSIGALDFYATTEEDCGLIMEEGKATISATINRKQSNDAVFTVNENTELTLSGTLKGGSNINLAGAGIVKLTGTMNNTGVLNVGSDVEVEFATAAAIKADKTISGTGTLVKTGADTVTLTGNMSGFTGAIRVDGGTLDLTSSNVDINKLTIAGVAEGATLKLTLPKRLTLESILLGQSPVVTMPATGVVNGTLQMVNGDETISATTANGTATFTGEKPTQNTQVTGNLWWWDYEFDGNGNNTGSDTTALTWDNDRPDTYKNGGEYTEAVEGVTNRELRLPARPWRNVSAFPAEMTAIMYCKAGATENAVLVSFGSSSKGSYNAITLMTGDNPEDGDMKLVLSYGLGRDNIPAYVITPLETLTVKNATSAYHLYAFTLRTVTKADNSQYTEVAIYVDGSLKTIYPHDEVITLGPGFQIASVHGGCPGEGVTGGINRLNDTDTATMDFLRVSNFALSEAAITQMAEDEDYKYVSQKGSAVRTFVTGDTWEDDANPWAQTMPKEDSTTGETVTTNKAAPNTDTNVTGYIDDNATVTLNNTAVPSYESLKFNETAPGKTLTLEGTGTLKTADFILETNLKMQYGAIDLSATSVTLGSASTKVNLELDVEALLAKTWKATEYHFASAVIVKSNSTVTLKGADSTTGVYTDTLGRTATISEDYKTLTVTIPAMTAEVTEDAAWDALTWAADTTTGIVAETFTLSGTGSVTLPADMLGANVKLVISEGVNVVSEGVLPLAAGSLSGAGALTVKTSALPTNLATLPADGWTGKIVLQVAADTTIAGDLAAKSAYEIVSIAEGETAPVVTLNGAQSGNNDMTIGDGTKAVTVKVTAANGGYGGTWTVNEKATLSNEGNTNYNPFCGGSDSTGELVVNGTLLVKPGTTDSHIWVPISGTGLISVEASSSIEGTVTLRDTLTIAEGVTLSGVTSVIGPSIVCNGTLSGTGVTIADGKSLSGAGEISAPVTFADGAIVDATESTAVTISGTVTYPESGSVTVKLSAEPTSAAGICALKSTATHSTPATTTFLVKKVADETESDMSDVLVVGRTDGLYVTKPTAVTLPELPNGETYEAETATALQKAAAIAGVETVSKYVFQTTTGNAVEGSADAIALFTNIIPTVTADNGGTATIVYDFGVERMTIATGIVTDAAADGKYVVLLASVKNAEDDSTADFNSNTELTLDGKENDVTTEHNLSLETLWDGAYYDKTNSKPKPGYGLVVIPYSKFSMNSDASSTTHLLKVKARSKTSGQ